MSLVEPLLLKEEVKVQNLETYSKDPLSNLEKTTEKLSIDYESFEFEYASVEEINNVLPGEKHPSWQIMCTVVYQNKLFTGNNDGLIKIYSLDTKEVIALKGHTNRVNCLHLRSSKFLISGSRDKTIIIWSLETYKQVKVIKVDNEKFCLEVNGDRIFYGSKSDTLIRGWNIRNEDEVSPLSGHENGITCMKCSKNQRFLAAGSLDGSIRTWSLSNLQELKAFKSMWKIQRIHITSDDKYILSKEKGSLKIWDVDKGENIKNWDYVNKNLLYVNGQNKCLFLESHRYVVSFDIESSKEIKNFYDSGIDAFTFSRNNNIGYYGQKNNTVLIRDEWRNEDIAILQDFGCEFTFSMMLIVGGWEQYLASVLSNGKIKIHIINIENIQEDFELGRISWEGNVKLTRDGQYLIIYYPGLEIWNLNERKKVFSYGKVDEVLEISNDGKYFAFKDLKGYIVYVYSFQEMKEITQFNLEYGNWSFWFSKDSRFISFCAKRKNIEVLDIANNSKIISLEGNGAKFIEINNTNEYLISAYGNDLCFWNLLELFSIKDRLSIKTIMIIYFIK